MPLPSQTPHKLLTKPKIASQDCNLYLLRSSKYLAAPVLWLSAAPSLGLDALAECCRSAILEMLVDNVISLDNSTRVTFPNTRDWDALTAEEYELLLNGVLQAFRQALKPVAEVGYFDRKTVLDKDLWGGVLEKIKPLTPLKQGELVSGAPPRRRSAFFHLLNCITAHLLLHTSHFHIYYDVIAT